MNLIKGEKIMNKLGDLLLEDMLEARKKSKGNEEKYYDHMCGGSIIAFINDHKGCFEIHGSTAGKLFVLKMCIKQLSKDLDVSIDEIMDFLKDALKADDKPF